MLNSYGGVSIFFACCAAGLFSGNAIACERADRSAHFLAYLPPTKKQILASKLVVAGGATAAVWGWALLSIFVIAPAFRSTVDVDGPQLWDFAAMSGLIFGVGWVLSALLEKPLVPIIGALVSPGFWHS
jgi:ABC-type transport system involved in multi-copper enzyme maturation permease subunit